LLSPKKNRCTGAKLMKCYSCVPDMAHRLP